MEISKQTQTAGNLRNGSITPKRLCAGYAFLLTVAACLFGITQTSALMLVVAALFAPLIFMPEFLLGPIVLFTIFDDYLLVGSSASVGRFVTLFFIAGALLVILKKGTIKQASLYFFLLLVFGVLLSFYSTQGYTSLPISYILNMILAVAMLNFSEVSTEEIAKQFFIYGVLALAFVYLLFMQNGFDSLVEGNRLTIDEETNSNQVAMGLAIVMALFVSNMLIFKKHKLITILLIVAVLVALFFTGSRTALIASIVMAFLLYLINAQDKRSKRKALLFLLFGTALFGLIYRILEDAYPLLMERFTMENIEESGGTGRLDVWKNYFIHFFPKYWFIGMGFDPLNLFYGLGSLFAEKHGAHNLLVEVLSKSGVVGLILYAVCFVKFFRATTKQLQANKYLLLPIAIVLTTLVNGLGEDVLTGRFLWFGIGLGYMLLHNGVNENKNALGRNP